MDKEIKEKWLAELRSGKFKQAKGALFNGEGGYCCIGVLAKTVGASDESLQGHWNTIAFDNLDVEDKVNSLPRHMRQMLAAMNDEGKSFSEIADWIEKHL